MTVTANSSMFSAIKSYIPIPKYFFAPPTIQCSDCFAFQEYEVTGNVGNYKMVLVEDHKENCPHVSLNGTRYEVYADE